MRRPVLTARRAALLAPLFAALALLTTPAQACPICATGGELTPAQRLINADQVLLLAPAPQGWQTRAVIKGEPAAPPAAEALPVPAPIAMPSPASGPVPWLAARDRYSGQWALYGPVGADHAPVLARAASAQRTAEMRIEDWVERVRFYAPYLEHREPLLAELAYSEIARAPYAAMRSLRGTVDPAQLARWLDDPALAARAPLYTLLLGIAGDAQTVPRVERALAESRKTRVPADPSALICALIELRGRDALTQIERLYLTDRSGDPVQARGALLALSVQGQADGVLPRADVIAAYRRLIQRRHPLAGLAAADLAAWQAWEVTPDYVALLNSSTLHPVSRVAIVSYLERSPHPAAKGR
jgi:hypothetical protein